MKITVNEARNDYKTFKLGSVKVTVEEPFESLGQAELSIKVEVPLKDKSGDPWDRDTSVGMYDLGGNRLEAILKRVYREIIGTALFNADHTEILKAKYDFGTFAKWEEEMLADSADIEALKAEIKKRLDAFKDLH